MAKQYQVPGGAYVNESGTRDYQIPGAGYVNETSSSGFSGTPDPASLVKTGGTPTLAVAFKFAPAVGSLAKTGKQPTLVVGYKFAPAVGSLVKGGQVPVLTLGYKFAPTVASLLKTGQIPSITVSTLTPTATTQDVGHARPRRRKEYVVIDDVVFEVANDAEAIALIRRAHQLARENAQAAAQAQLAKQPKPVKRSRKATAPPSAPEPDVPKITLSPGLQPIWPQVVRVRDDIAELYRAALIAAWLRQQDDEDDMEILLLS